MVAYDYFLAGLELFHKGDSESIQESIIYFKKAIIEDNEFARAYADVAIAYYFLDAYQTEKQYSVEINNYADKALLLDSKLPQSLIAKALDYMHSAENELAVPYLEKALEYNPNSALVINILSDFYTNYVPNTEKYLEYALKGISLDIYRYENNKIAVVLSQVGLIEESKKYMEDYKNYAENDKSIYQQLSLATYYSYSGDTDKAIEHLKLFSQQDNNLFKY